MLFNRLLHLINEGSAGYSRETAQKFCDTLNAQYGKKKVFHVVKNGDYFQIATKVKKLNEDAPYFSDLKIYDRVFVLPGEDNTALVNIGNIFYYVSYDNGHFISKVKEYDPDTNESTLKVVSNPKIFNNAKIKSAILDAIKTPLFESKLNRIILSTLLGLSGLGAQGAANSNVEKKNMSNEIIKEPTIEKIDFDRLIDALIKVESGGNDTAVGDDGKAFGPLQLWQIYVDDVNRIYKTNYKHSDAFDRERAVDIVKKYLSFWGKKYKMKTGKEPTYEVLAKIHNGGPNGPLNPATETYWTKVRQNL